METLALVYKAAGIFLVVAWGISLLSTRGQPADWTPPRIQRLRERSGRPLEWIGTRDHYRIVCVVGILVGLVVLALSYAIR